MNIIRGAGGGGGKGMKIVKNENEFDWNDPNFTTSDHLINTMSQDYLDQENVKRHNRKFK